MTLTDKKGGRHIQLYQKLEFLGKELTKLIGEHMAKNGEKIAKGRALMPASWASLLRYHTFQTYIVLVNQTGLFILYNRGEEFLFLPQSNM